MRKTLLIFIILSVFILTACDESLYVYEDSPVVFDEAATAQTPSSTFPNSTNIHQIRAAAGNYVT